MFGRLKKLEAENNRLRKRLERLEGVMVKSGVLDAFWYALNKSIEPTPHVHRVQKQVDLLLSHFDLEMHTVPEMPSRTILRKKTKEAKK